MKEKGFLVCYVEGAAFKLICRKINSENEDKGKHVYLEKIW